ncbi:group I intron-associated PD-(D/E)XK endonuclease [Haloarchaeobius sp. DT45]|uniref:group I intron-associated PD-(D/E)XK endonuclease n=1 Tax=Haloarchaeobius sp. DT45 TaxID=3446116 RepID=UPI003F6AF56B
MVHCPTQNSFFLVPIEDASKGEMVLRTEPTANNQSKGINWAEDYNLNTQLQLMQGT